MAEATFGATVKALREGLGNSIETCASESGLRVEYWESIENNMAAPELGLLWRIATALECTPHELI
jgi:transcriptional regulator with XRE-family HTH domain